jgi:hypothetical protein
LAECTFSLAFLAGGGSRQSATLFFGSLETACAAWALVQIDGVTGGQFLSPRCYYVCSVHSSFRQFMTSLLLFEIPSGSGFRELNPLILVLVREIWNPVQETSHTDMSVLEQLTFICCRAAGSAVNAKQLRQDSATAAHTAWDKRAQEALWRSDRWEEVLGKVIFRQVTHFAVPPEELVGMKRQPNEYVTAGHFESARLRRAVYYESPTELRVFRWLERSPSVRWYQEQPVRVLYAYRGLLKPYFPDAAVMGEDGRVMVVEVKPSFEMYRDITLAKATGALQHFGSRGIGFLMVDSSGQTLHDIAQHPFSPAVAEAIEALFGPRPVRFGQVRRKLEALMGRFDQKVFASMVVNRDWAVTRAPGVLVSRLPPELSFRVLLAGAAG